MKGEGTAASPDLVVRTREIALRVIRMFSALPKTTEAQVLGKQILRSGTSIGANYREAQRGAPDAALPALDWWRGFRSGELTALMEAAQIYNLDIAVAVAQIVQADAQVGVTGAALLVRRKVFEAVGGICEDYIIGDYEDSDFCLRLQAAGSAIAYAPDAELYHFERRSIQTHPGYAGTLTSLFNRRLHHARWDDAMTSLMAQRAFRVRP